MFAAKASSAFLFAAVSFDFALARLVRLPSSAPCAFLRASELGEPSSATMDGNAVRHELELATAAGEMSLGRYRGGTTGYSYCRLLGGATGVPSQPS